MKILVTGFDPFGGDKINPAIEAVKRLPDEINGAEIIKLEIPTVFNKSAEVVRKAIEKENPDYVFLRREMRNQTKQNAQIFNAVRYVDGYQDAINREDLVVMRRIDPDICADQLKNARKSYEESNNQGSVELHLGQLTIFDFINAGSDG